jgi:hypothetical protein
MTQEEIEFQMRLLNIHRRTLRVYVEQLAKLQLNTPPYVIHGIGEARSAIARIKKLPGVGAVEDHDIDSVSDWEHEFGVE